MADVLCSEFTKARATNSTDTSFPSRVATTTQPADDGVVDLRRSGRVPEFALVSFFGAGNDDTTFDARLIGWRKVSTLWVPVILAGLSLTLSTSVGVASTAVLNTERFADTVTRAVGLPDNNGIYLISPANNTPGGVLVRVLGCALLEVTFDLIGATSANALIAPVW